MKSVAYNKSYARICNNTDGIVNIILRFSTVIVVISVGFSYFSKWFNDLCLEDEYTDEKKQPNFTGKLNYFTNFTICLNLDICLDL